MSPELKRKFRKLKLLYASGKATDEYSKALEQCYDLFGDLAGADENLRFAEQAEIQQVFQRMKQKRHDVGSQPIANRIMLPPFRDSKLPPGNKIFR